MTKLGDNATINGVDYEVREFTAAEHQAWDEMLEERGIHKLAAKAQVGAFMRGNPEREGRRESIIKRKVRALEPEFEKLSKRKNPTDEEELRLLEVGAELDLLEEKLEELEAERLSRGLLDREAYLSELDAARVDFMRGVLGADEAWAASLSDADLVTLAEVVEVGKARQPLSSFSRELGRTLTKAMPQAKNAN